MAIAKPPRQLLPNLYRFAPNRETLGGTAYFLMTPAGNVLLDCPSWDADVESWLKQWGGVRWLCLTHRDGHSPKLPVIQATLQCQVIVQEQEAYLLPKLSPCRFRDQLSLSPSLTALWTPGYSPGSACYYWGDHGGILFTGRHLLPSATGELAAIKQPKTFHWGRQQRSIGKIWQYIQSRPLMAICPGGNIGYLRGKDWLGEPKTPLQTLVGDPGVMAPIP